MSERFDHEPDRLPARRIAAIAIATLVIFAAGAGWVVRVERRLMGGVRPDTGPRAEEAGQREVGIVVQQPFEDEDIAGRKEAAARRRLNSAGWVDRDAGVVHVPIEDAMKMVVERGTL